MPNKRERTATATPGGGQGGFTLIEMLIVLVIAGLMIGLVVTRGPLRSVTLDVRSAASSVAQALRLARSQAILGNRSVNFVLDTGARSFRVEGTPMRFLPRGLDVSAVVTAGEAAANRIAGIDFLPDGSSTGGTIALAEGGRRMLVQVDWLTGRVSVADAR